MSDWNIAAKSQEERDKVNVDLAASGVAYKERLNIPVIAEQVAREQPENLRAYFMERLRHYRQLSLQLPKGSDPVYQNEDAPKKITARWGRNVISPQRGAPTNPAFTNYAFSMYTV